jgi:flagellar basal-body rod modification protein FlgD
MAVTGVPGVQTAAAGTAGTTSTEKSNVLGQDAFLKLLITQLQNQNPLEPMKDTEFIAQMAQFSALEQMTQVKEEIRGLREDLAAGLEKINETLSGIQGGDVDTGELKAAVDAVNLLGEKVMAQAEDKVIEGIVESVRNLTTVPILLVAGREFNLSSIIKVLT